MTSMKLNCDLGESFGSWQMGQDEQIMPLIDQANIACGMHAGDPLILQRTLQLAKAQNVEIGAHPSYPDLQGFGRRSMTMQQDELTALLHYQIAAVDGMASNLGLSLTYVKPHGALYNDMMASTKKEPELLNWVMQAIADYHKPLGLMIQSTANWQQHLEAAQKLGIELYFEAFSDRRYMPDGSLMPRSQAGAVLNAEQSLAQVKTLLESQCVITSDNQALPLKVDSLCVHSDSPDSLIIAQQIRDLVSNHANNG